MRETLSALIQDFFTKMSIQMDSLTIEATDGEVSTYEIRVQTSDSKILIGVHGQTLEHITHLLGRMAEKVLKQHCTIHVEVNDYMKSKEERLLRYIDSKIAEAEASGETVALSKMTGIERKKIHHYILSKNRADLSTRSE